MVDRVHFIDTWRRRERGMRREIRDICQNREWAMMMNNAELSFCFVEPTEETAGVLEGSKKSANTILGLLHLHAVLNLGPRANSLLA